jgi:uncharacterized lipoprotein YddW (UPF0748 family)
LTIRPASLSLLLIIASYHGSAQNHRVPPPPKYEVRAVWLATAAGLDWPRSSDRSQQEATLREIVRFLAAANFNTIFFQVRARGDAYYRSSYEPWAENLTGTLGKDPGWDPLACLLAEAHAARMEVHAWINVYKVRGPGPVSSSSPLHPARAHPEWTVNYRGEGWFDPGNPAVRGYLINLVLDLVRNYDIDGVNFDYARYPGKDFPDGETYRRFGNGTAREEWRRANVDRFIALSFDRLTAIRPLLKVGASPLGAASSESGESPGALALFSQDASGWMKAGKLDYVSPQLYWDIGASKGDPDFVWHLRNWQENASGRHVYAGIAAYKADVAREIPAEIDSTRAAGTAGQSFFRFENVRNLSLLEGRYDTPAAIPPMPWKDAIPPSPPGTVAVSEVETNVFQIEWLPSSRASDGDLAHSYRVYRWPTTAIPFDDPRALAAVTSGGVTVCLDTLHPPAGPANFYAVTAVDRANNEGLPSPVSGGIVKEFVALRRKLTEVTALSASLSNDSGTPHLIAYSLQSRSPVELVLISHSQSAGDTVVASLVNGVQEGGIYIVGVGNVRFGPGRYLVRLKAGDTTVEQPIDMTR